MDKMVEELRAAGYTQAQIDRELRYMERVARENELIRSDSNWNYGFIAPDCISQEN